MLCSGKEGVKFDQLVHQAGYLKYLTLLNMELGNQVPRT